MSKNQLKEEEFCGLAWGLLLDDVKHICVTSGFCFPKFFSSLPRKSQSSYIDSPFSTKSRWDIVTYVLQFIISHGTTC